METLTVGDVLVNWLHLSAAMVWLGAIFSGSAVLMRRGTDAPRPVSTRVTAVFYRVFSPYAWMALGVLIVTGTLKAGNHLEGGWSDLLVTPWGRLLLSKLAIAALMIGSGAYATYVVAPRLSVRTTTARDARRAAALERRLQLIETGTALLGFALLLIVTLL